MSYVPDELLEIQYEARHDFFMIYNIFVDRYCRELEYLEISLYVALNRFAGSRTAAWPSYGTLAEVLGSSKRRIIEAMKVLEEKGLVRSQQRERGNGSSTSNLYIITNIQMGGDLKSPGGGDLKSPGGDLKSPGGGDLKSPPEEEHVLKNKEKKNTLAAEQPCVRESDIQFDVFEKSTPPENKARVMADRFYNAISRKVGDLGRPSLARWENEFRLLLARITIPEDQFIRVLDWYCEHIGEEFIPMARTAGAFSSKFGQIHLAWKRSEAERPAEDDESKVTVPKMVFTESTMTDEEFEAYLASI